jgi:hypothetical protein
MLSALVILKRELEGVDRIETGQQQQPGAHGERAGTARQHAPEAQQPSIPGDDAGEREQRGEND